MGKTLPDFIGVGAMKSGTTTLYHLLRQQPEIHMSSFKETEFFHRRWDRGLDWYAELFAGARDDQLTGEISPSYMVPQENEIAAERMAKLVPDVRLIAVLRDPVARLRSHYRHNIFLGHEDKPFDEVVRVGCPYLRLSSYAQCLRPYFDRFPADRILVVRYEDVFAEDHRGWHRILRFLGVPERPRPEGSWEVAAKKDPRTKVRRVLETTGMIRASGYLPRPAREAAKRVLRLTRAERTAHALAAASVDAPIPDDVLAAIYEDQRALDELTTGATHFVTA